MIEMTEVPMFTSRFKAVSDLDKRLPEGESRGFVPVRTSLGKPRWIGESSKWPYLSDLAPHGLRSITDKQEFNARYRARLDKVGVEAIGTELAKVYLHQTPGSWQVTRPSERLPLVLLCFEDVDKPEDWCHRSVFALWWFEQTGQAVAELNHADDLQALHARS